MAIFSSLAAAILCGIEIAGSVNAYSFYYENDTRWVCKLFKDFVSFLRVSDERFFVSITVNTYEIN